MAIENTYDLLPLQKRKMMMIYFIDRDITLPERAIYEILGLDRTTLWRWKKQIIKRFGKELKRLRNEIKIT